MYLIACIELCHILVSTILRRHVDDASPPAATSQGGGRGGEASSQQNGARALATARVVGGGTGSGEGVGVGVEPLSPVAESMVPVAALILGADSAPTLAGAVALMRLAPFVTYTTQDSHSQHSAAGQLISEMLVCYVATLLFYGTGHRPTFEGIQYGAAFVGIDDVSVNDTAHFW